MLPIICSGELPEHRSDSWTKMPEISLKNMPKTSLEKPQPSPDGNHALALPLEAFRQPLEKCMFQSTSKKMPKIPCLKWFKTSEKNSDSSSMRYYVILKKKICTETTIWIMNSILLTLESQFSIFNHKNICTISSRYLGWIPKPEDEHTKNLVP